MSEYYDQRGHIRPYPGYVTYDYWFGPLVNYHRKVAKLALLMEEDGYKIPPGVRWAMKHRMTWNQLAAKHPWAIYIKLSNGKRYRVKKATIGDAIMFHKRVVKRHPTATIVSIRRNYDISPEWRGKLPSGWRWCPCCLKPRRFQRLYSPQGEPISFYGPLKAWSRKKRRWETKDRKLHLMRCPMCGITNRDPVFRRSNQPYHTTRYKKGALKATDRNRLKRKRKRRTKRKELVHA